MQKSRIDEGGDTCLTVRQEASRTNLWESMLECRVNCVKALSARTPHDCASMIQLKELCSVKTTENHSTVDFVPNHMRMMFNFHQLSFM